MRILGIGDCIELGDMYLALSRERHDVRVVATDPDHAGTFEGLIAPASDWKAELPWVGRDGLILFELVGQGAIQDALRAEGYRVIGGSAFGDRLENDRALGQAILREAGLRVAESRPFDDPVEADLWVARNPGRYVLKYDDSASPTFVGIHARGDDLRFQLAHGPQSRVLLMNFLDGVEVGIGAYFDGLQFLKPICIDFEHKRFFPGDIGEMTGEMGTLAGYRGGDRLFAATLAKMAPKLAQNGHVGYVNLNLIVNEDGIWPLEFTCRFGYPGFAVLAPLQQEGWGNLFQQMLDRRGGKFPTLDGWSVAIVLTMPPFPAKGRLDALPRDDPPIFFHVEPQGAEAAHYHLSDVRMDGAQLYARRRTGYIMVVTGTGSEVEDAQQAACKRAANVIIPEMRWRADIGDRFLRSDRNRLRKLGWID